MFDNGYVCDITMETISFEDGKAQRNGPDCSVKLAFIHT
jgi:hypothetical protein